MGILSDRMIGAAAATLDRAVAAVIHNRRRGRHEDLSHEERLRLLWEIHEQYGAPELYAHPDAFFTPPDPIDPRLHRVRELPNGGRVVDASWQSRFDPYLPAMRDAWSEHARNATSHARLHLHAEPRPAVVLVHGYMGGTFRFEELVWPLRWFHRRGLDVALVQLPFHGLRASIDSNGAAAYPFPGSDPRLTNEGFRQSVHDIRALVRWLRFRGSPDVGMIGMSLGGYTTSLMATVEQGISVAVPMIPLASLADFARDQGRLGSRKERPAQHRALDAANFVVSPFARPSLVPSDRVLIVAAEADRITPMAHAVRLSHHFAADIASFPGGHLMHLGIRGCWRAVGELLERAGMFLPREGGSRAQGDHAAGARDGRVAERAA